MSKLGLIVGSGLIALDIDVAARAQTHTPYGPPSSPVLSVVIAGHRIPCIARHGEAHAIAPHEVNYRANVWALYQHGVRRLVGVNVVGTIAADFRPGELAVPEQLIDYTWGRESTFGGGERGVLHAEFAEPFSAELAAELVAAGGTLGIAMRRGVYGVTQGPRLETVAEIDRLERDGCTMVGMTAMPEAVLARELGIDYAVLALGVNHAAGRGPRGESVHAQIESHLKEGMTRVARILETLVQDAASRAAL
ncbi:MAG TPA: S-methyl-5'-thioinosine phosphorylase [Gammaproteobacteria bacterium]